MRLLFDVRVKLFTLTSGKIYLAGRGGSERDKSSL